MILLDFQPQVRQARRASSLLLLPFNILDKENAPAKQILSSSGHITGSFKDAQAIRKLAAECDVLTAEIEHIDTRVLEELTAIGAVFEPHWRTVATIQDKFDQKQHLKHAGVPTAEATLLDSGSIQELERVAEAFSYPFMLKSRREAYDGRGNLPVTSKDELASGRLL